MLDFKVLRKDSHLMKMVNSSLYDLPSPSNMSYWWNFGSLLGVFLFVQMLTGLFLSMHYSASVELAFQSVTKMQREMSAGWIMRFLHVGGASAYFIFMYLHISRGLWKFSFFLSPKTWKAGVTMLILSMATAFLGYVLPWGQMSYWGATVITKFISVIPYVGSDFVTWLWGGFSVKNPTLMRFFSLHFLLPMMVGVFVFMHFLFLHERGSTNPSLLSSVDKSPFFPFFMYKDLVGFLMGMFFAYFMMFYSPGMVLEEQNFMGANFLVTPEHMQPEWYFLAAYAVLRAVPKKLGGVLSLVLFIVLFYLLPFLSKENLLKKKKEYQWFFFFWLANFLFLTWMGGQPVEDPYMFFSQVGYFVYFTYFFFVFFLSKKK